MQVQEITILCDVVDNFGDIGFVYRLSRSISEINPKISLRLVVNNLAVFSKMESKINPNLAEQKIESWNWKIFDWNKTENCLKEFLKNPPKIILQCFQCKRPLWLDDILFSENFSQKVQIVNIEYLTAESWADDFHLLKSGTRSVFVKKVNFMPGFSEKTGGLILDKPFVDFLYSSQSFKNQKALNFVKNVLSQQEVSLFSNENVFCTSVFLYQKDFSCQIKALKLYQDFKKLQNPNFKVHIFLANSVHIKNFENLCKQNQIEFSKLEYLQQETWDAFLTLCDFNFVRGEDSFSRAVLSGVPFFWQAYVQDDEFQLVKVASFLQKLKPFFKTDFADFSDFTDFTADFSSDFFSDFFSDYKKALLNFNLSENAKISQESLYKSPELSNVIDFVTKNSLSLQEQSQILFLLLKNYDLLKKIFKNFAKSIFKLGNLSEHLLTYLENL